MLKVTQRDRIFLGVVVPLGLLACFFHFVHRPLASRVAAARERLEALGTPDDLAAERARLEAARESGLRKAAAAEDADRAALAREAAEDAGEGGAAPSRDPSARLRRVVALLGGLDGVRVVSTLRVDENVGGEEEEGECGGAAAPRRAAPIVSNANGGAGPALWRVEVHADYAAFVRALEEISARRLPMVVESVSFSNLEGRGGGVRRWRLDICL